MSNAPPFDLSLICVKLLRSGGRCDLVLVDDVIGHPIEKAADEMIRRERLHLVKTVAEFSLYRDQYKKPDIDFDSLRRAPVGRDSAAVQSWRKVARVMSVLKSESTRDSWVWARTMLDSNDTRHLQVESLMRAIVGMRMAERNNKQVCRDWLDMLRRVIGDRHAMAVPEILQRMGEMTRPPKA